MGRESQLLVKSLAEHASDSRSEGDADGAALEMRLGRYVAVGPGWRKW